MKIVNQVFHTCNFEIIIFPWCGFVSIGVPSCLSPPFLYLSPPAVSPHVIIVVSPLVRVTSLTFCYLCVALHCKHGQRQKTQYHTAKVHLTVSLGVLLLFGSRDASCSVSALPSMLVSVIQFLQVNICICMFTYISIDLISEGTYVICLFWDWLISLRKIVSVIGITVLVIGFTLSGCAASHRVEVAQFLDPLLFQ